MPLLPSVSLVANSYAALPERGLHEGGAGRGLGARGAQQSAGSAVDRLLEATQIDRVWKAVQGRISAHFIDHYQERVKEKCGSRPSSQAAPEPTAATAPVAGPEPLSADASEAPQPPA